MRAIQYKRYGDYQANQLVHLDPPEYDDAGVLVRMEFAGINPLDNTFRSGHFYAATPDNLPRVGGQTGVGIVERSSHSKFKPGDRVFVFGKGFGVTADGTWRDYILLQDDNLLPVPEGVSAPNAAAFLAGAGYLTGYLALTHLAHLKKGQSILAPGIGGAVGMETIQIARELGAGLTISTAGTTAKAEQARLAGYEHVIDLSTTSVTDELLRMTKDAGVDIVVDGVSGELFPKLLHGIAFGGTYIVVGYAGGREAKTDVTDIIWKSATVKGFTFRAIPPDVVRSAQLACIEMLASGRLAPTVAQAFPMSEAARAVEYLVESRPFGRVLLDLNQG